MAGPYGARSTPRSVTMAVTSAGRGHVEGRVAGRHALPGAMQLAEDPHHLVGGALLDGDAGPGGERRVEGAPGRGHVERDGVVARPAPPAP